MNGNRMKYASTPTFGIQKRGLWKKNTPVRQQPQSPDFSQAPGLSNPMPVSGQQPFAQPVPFGGAPFPASSAGSAPMATSPFPGYSAGVPAASPFAQPVQQPASQPIFTQTATQAPFAAPSFITQGGGVQLPPMQTGYANQPLPPLGNSAPTFHPVSSYPTRGQGYAPVMQATAPGVQPTAGFSPLRQPSPVHAAQAPFGAPAAQPASDAQTGYSAFWQPMFAQPAAPAQPQAFPSEPENAPQTLPACEQLPADKLWTLFLFGLLPLLFLPCLFVPGTFDWVRYIFLGLTAVGLGGMWYRQMYGPSTRLIISMVYVALCVAAVAMMLQGGADVRQVYSQATPLVSAMPSPAQETNYAGAPVDFLAEPTPSGPSQAELRLKLFMSLWQVNNTTEMVELVQPSWRSQQENASQSLFKLLKNRTAEEYVIEEIDGSDSDNSRTVTMRATINKNTGKAPVTYRFMVMMVREGDEWYVNPNSLATNDEVNQTEENVVNNRNAVGNVTEAPRMTVTPAPPANTPLYYNEGAHNYHMDPNCSRVAVEFLPFDHEFAYIDLATYKKSPYNLTPCLACNAPVDTLH